MQPLLDPAVLTRAQFGVESEMPFCGLVARKYRVVNDLRAILVRDPSAPLVQIDVWYGVGSADDRPGKTGLAHLLEHLQHAGMPGNAATSKDWTRYHALVHNSNIDFVLKREGLSMWKPLLVPSSVLREREVVASELLYRSHHALWSELDRLAFAQHGYGSPTVGNLEEDIVTLSVRDLEIFHRCFYAPNNACVVVIGDFDEFEVLEIIRERFAFRRPQELPTNRRTPMTEQRRERRLRLPRRRIPTEVGIGYRCAARSDASWAGLELVEVLVESAVARELDASSSAGCSLFGGTDGGLVTIQVRSDAPSASVISAVDRAIERLQRGGVSKAQLEGARREAETRLWLDLSSWEDKAAKLGYFETVVGDYGGATGELESIRTVDMDTVCQRLTELDPSRRSIVVFGE